MAVNLNIDTYMTPIPGPNPAGEDLRYTQIYDQIKEAKRSDDLLEKGEWETDLKRSDWRLTASICGETLIHKSKDLQIAVWLTEALLHLNGFSGLAFGLQLSSRLLADYWESLYPQIEDADLDYRAGPLTYLNEKLSTAVFQVPLCDPSQSKGYAYFEWEESRLVGFDNNLDKEQKDRRQEMIDDGKVTAEAFQTAVNLTAIGFYKTLHGNVADCRTQLKHLDERVTEQFKPDPPGLTRIIEAVEAVYRVIEKTYQKKKKSEVAQSEDDDLGAVADEAAFDESDPMDAADSAMAAANLFSKKNAITDISNEERALWKKVAGKAGNGHLKSALDQLLAAAALAPSVRQKNRYLLLVAKLCLRAGRHDLAKPIVEELYVMIEALELEKWEHPAWIAEVIETLYRCLEKDGDAEAERATQLFQKLCTLNITKAATFRIGGVS